MNLYRVIGENTYGVPDTDTGRQTEQVEMWIAKHWLISSRESWPTISKAEMDAEIRKFLAETYYIYREILHKLTDPKDTWNVYTGETLRCADSGEPITIKEMQE